jgi:hypothetical protein
VYVEQGNGATSLFMTLSCTEYHWQDIEKLLNSRIKIAGDPPVSLKSVTEKVRAVFGIHHYYVRFEFAKSWVQIHVHIWSMLGKKSSLIELNDLVYKERHDVEKQARVADDWMTNVFGLTAIHPGSSTGGVLDRTKIRKPEGTYKTQLNHPSYHCRRL